jgi:hypothetical protein
LDTETKPTTGATPDQLRKAAVDNPRFHWRGNIEELAEQYAEYEEACIAEVESIARYLVPPGYAIVRTSDAITPLLLEAMRAVMQIATIDQLSDAHLDELVYAIRGTTNPETWSEDQP